MKRTGKRTGSAVAIISAVSLGFSACAVELGTTSSSDGDSATENSSDSDGGDAGPVDGSPVLPPIEGECPVFETGIVSAGLLDDIYLQVGPMGTGDGALLFYWHGTASTADEADELIPQSVRDDILDEGGMIAAFNSSVGTGDNCSGTGIFRADDFEVADLIAACAVRDYKIDPRRIYTTGCSAGGLQSGCMGIRRSEYIAATVPNSGGVIFKEDVGSGTAMPAVMTLHGGDSDVVIVSFADTSLTYDEMMAEAGSFVVNCNHGGGHCEAPSNLYEAAWTFMKAHPYGTAPSPYLSGLSAEFPDYCEIFQPGPDALRL